MRNAFLLITIATLVLAGCPDAVNPCDTGTCDAQDVDDASDTIATIDSLDAPTDTPADASHALGAPCTDDSQCESGICLSPPIGRCSIPCMQRHDCPSGNNWTCSGVPGRGTICDCAMRDTREIGCNGLDDDCDGLTDEHSQDCMGLCTDLWNNPRNCGGCGVACTNGSVCQNGMCTCPTDRPDICGTSCVNLQTDVMHCGNCTSPCPMQANSTPACSAGLCGVTCTAGFGDCNHAAGDGCETDVRGDPLNCGMCGNACSFPHAMANCSTGTCVMGACEAGFANCNGSSLDGCEAVVANDAMNCGMCGNVCNAPNATSVCSSGVCSLAACTTGYGNCNGSAVDGCEVNLQTNPLHCSVCGGACPARANASATCTGGTCGFTCGFGFGNCDANATNGCETPLLSDPNNCGACGTLCSAGPNQAATCNSGTCQRTCSPGFGDCDGNPTNGCETDLRTSLSSCGACGSVCSRPNATAVCSAGSCSTVTCNSGFANCDGADFNGCEVNLQTDPLHCGSCALTCPGASAANTVATCTASTCGYSCATGYSNCDGSLTNGCEANTASDRNNCGSCGNVCAAPLSCSSGACVADPTFRVTSFSTSGCVLSANQEGQAGDDAGGLGVGRSSVFYTGDSQSITLPASDLSSISTAVNRVWSFVSDVRSGDVYTLMDAAGTAQPTATFPSGNFQVTQLGLLDPVTGAITSTRIALSTPIYFANSAVGIYSGYGRVIFYTGNTGDASRGWYNVDLPSGLVRPIVTGASAMPEPTANGCETFAHWGTAEFFAGEYHVLYVQTGPAPAGIYRFTPRTGVLDPSPVVDFGGSGGDICMAVLSPSRNRWYFHYEGAPTFAPPPGGMFGEFIGYCSATWDAP